MRISLALLLGAALLAPMTALSGPAAAAADTCRGLPATIVGTSGVPVTGTEDDDVIVSNGASVEALGGDDVVCMTPGVGSTSGHVEAGAGDDVVDASALPASVGSFAQLSSGADTFEGGPGEDVVEAADWLEPDGPYRTRYVDEDADDISTGNGEDRVYTGSDGPLADVVDLGAGGGELQVSSEALAAGGSLDLGTGARLIFIRPASDETWEIDNAARTAEVAGASAGLTWSGVASPLYSFGEQPVRYRGTAASEEVTVEWLLSASMGGGDDELVTLAWEDAREHRVLGGTGRDLLDLGSLFSPDEYVPSDIDLDLDVTAGVATFATEFRESSYPVVRAAGIERWVASGFHDAVVRGSARDDELVVEYGDGTIYGGLGDDVVRNDGTGSTLISASVRLVGGPGDDTLVNVENSEMMQGGPGNDSLTGGVGVDRMYGDAGRDVLRGGPGPDDLYGGDGNDVLNGGQDADRAWGGRGTDRCVAEQRTGCER